MHNRLTIAAGNSGEEIGIDEVPSLSLVARITIVSAPSRNNPYI